MQSLSPSSHPAGAPRDFSWPPRAGSGADPRRAAPETLRVATEPREEPLGDLAVALLLGGSALGCIGLMIASAFGVSLLL